MPKSITDTSFSTMNCSSQPPGVINMENYDSGRSPFVDCVARHSLNQVCQIKLTWAHCEGGNALDCNHQTSLGLSKLYDELHKIIYCIAYSLLWPRTRGLPVILPQKRRCQRKESLGDTVLILAMKEVGLIPTHGSFFLLMEVSWVFSYDRKSLQATPDAHLIY